MRVHLELKPVRPLRSLDGTLESPFDPSPEFRQGWWQRPGSEYDSSQVRCFVFLHNGLEVARAELAIEAEPGPGYDVPASEDPAVEIRFFEVAASRQGQGIGHTAVRLLVEQFEGDRLFTYSEEVDGFWAALGWTRYDHPDGAQFQRPLYLREP